MYSKRNGEFIWKSSTSYRDEVDNENGNGENEDVRQERQAGDLRRTFVKIFLTLALARTDGPVRHAVVHAVPTRGG